MKYLTAAALLLTSWMAGARAQLYNLTCGSSGYTGAGVLGQAGDYWNSTNGQAVRLADSVQDSSPKLECILRAEPLGTAYFSIGSETSNNPNPDFMGSYLYSPPYNPMTFFEASVEGLTVGDAYTFIVYGAAGSGQGDYLSLTNYFGTPLAPGETTATSANIGEGDGTAYYEFTGTVPAFGELNLVVFANNTTIGPVLNGLQILQSPVPEPGAAGLVLLGIPVLALGRFPMARRPAAARRGLKR